MSEESSDRLAEESPASIAVAPMLGTIEMPITARQAVNRDQSPAVAKEASYALSAVDPMKAPFPAADEESEAQPVSEAHCTFSHWHRLDGTTRRLLLWAACVLVAALILRVGSAVQPGFVSPRERLDKFADVVEQRLPTILYGVDEFGFVPPTLNLAWNIEPSPNPSHPLKAQMTFEEASFSQAGRVIYTRYAIDYRWRHDHWQCENLKCDVERPELSKLDLMDFNTVVAHESLDRSLELVKLRRAHAEAMLRPSHPLGELLRSANLY